MKTGRTRRDHLRFAVLYEVVLLFITTPAVAWVLDKPLEHVGALGLTLIFVSVVLNFIYNRLFDAMWVKKQYRFMQHNFLSRSFHAIGLECILLLAALPITMWFLNLSLKTAFLTEFSLSVFIVFYTYFFTLTYDWAFPVLSGSEQG